MGNQIGRIPVPDAPPPPPPSPPIDDASTESPSSQQQTPSGGIEFRGRWCYALRPRRRPRGAAAQRRARERHLAAVAYYRYKIGVKIKTSQQVEAFGFQGPSGEFLLVEDSGITTELEQGLPTGADEKWVGFRPPEGSTRKLFPSPLLVICYRFRLVVSPVPHPPQPVLLVATYPPVRFSTHHLKTLVLLSLGERRLKVTTNAQV